MDLPQGLPEGLLREYPQTDLGALRCVVNLVRADAILLAALNRRFRAFGLTPASFNVLAVLRWAGEPLCPYELGERLSVTRGTVTGVLDSLEKRGLIERKAHPSDRRMLLIGLTEPGGLLLDDLMPAHYESMKEIFSGFSPEEKEILAALLARVQEAVARTAKSKGGGNVELEAV